MNAASGSIAASSAATAAAEEQARVQREEEEAMTAYSAPDLSEDWEFKILRSVGQQFKTRDGLRRALDEEAAAGWVLVEKFDDGRVRLKRPASAKKNDASLAIDPYRTYAGRTPNQQGMLVLSIVLGVLAFGAMIGVLVVFLNG